MISADSYGWEDEDGNDSDLNSDEEQSFGEGIEENPMEDFDSEELDDGEN